MPLDWIRSRWEQCYENGAIASGFDGLARRSARRGDPLPCMKAHPPMIRIKRVYEAVDKSDGQRFLVERLWPRGIKKAALAMAGWARNVAPDDALRRWFNHGPAKWEVFQHRYRLELDAKPERWESLLKAAENGNVALLFSARDLEHNNAVVLKAYLDERLKRRQQPARHGTRLDGRREHGVGR